MILSALTGLDEAMVNQELPGKDTNKNEGVNPLEHDLQNYQSSLTLNKDALSLESVITDCRYVIAHE